MSDRGIGDPDTPSGPHPNEGTASAGVAFEGVTVRLGGTAVVDGVDATVEPGRFVGLVGPNGAGKTTLLRTVNGRIAPDAGSVTVGGRRVDELAPKAVGRRVATVPQRTELSFAFSVRDVVEMGRFPHRSRLSLTDPGADRIDWAMARADVAHLAERPVTATSGGERQRVLLARALAQDTPVLLLDEPTANLDVNHQVRTLALVRDLVDRAGRTVVAAIHDLDLAARFCDELLLLADGRLRAAGPPDVVLDEDAVEGTFETPAVIGRNPATGTPTVTALPDRTAADRRGQVHVVGGGGRAGPLLGRLVAAGYAVSLGPVAADDPDAAVASALDVELASVPPFTSMGGTEGAAAARALARRADATVLADVDVGPTNAAVLGVAAAADRLVVVEDRPFAARNHAGAAAAERYAALATRGRVVDPEAALDAVAAVVGAGRAVAADGGGRPGRSPSRPDWP